MDTPTEGPLHLQPDRLHHMQRTKKLCCNAQSWGGTLTPSDHKLVTLDFDLRALRGLRRRQEQAHSSEAATRLTTHLLVHDSKYRTMYRQLLEKNLADLPEHRATTDQHWTTTLNAALEAAADSVGYMPIVNHTKEVDPELSRLSYEQRLRQLIYNDHKQDVKALRTKRNRLLHRIQERSKALAGAFIDEKLAIIEQSNRSTQVLKATRALFRRRSPLTSLCDSTGKYILGRQEAGANIKQHFQERFPDPTRTPVAADDLPRPLNNPITASELDRAFRRLRNGRATGPDSNPCRATQVWIRSISSTPGRHHQSRTYHRRQHPPGRRDSPRTSQAKQAGWPMRQPSTYRPTQQHP